MRVELFERTNKKKGNTLCLLMYYGSETINGKKRLKCKVESLGMFINPNPLNEQEKRENKQKWRIAQKIRAEREMQLLSGKYDIILEEQKKHQKNKGIQLIPYMQKMIDERKQKGVKTSGWDGAMKHLNLFCGNKKNITLAEVDKKFLLDYQNYLNTTTNTKGEKPLLQNSRCCYYNKLHITLRTAYEEELIVKNPCKQVKPIKAEQTERTYLTIDEVQAMANTDCRCKVLKQAFIFSCFTGLRWSDINLLLWKQVVEENGNYKIKFRQKKTKKLQYLNLNKQAVELLGERQEDEERVFKGLRYSTEMNNRLLKWAMDSGISKWVTFHVARHTHATLLLTQGADLYVVSKLLGHSEIRTTQIYTQVIDKKRQEAVDMLPQIDFKL